jgi:hypothetical protein
MLRNLLMTQGKEVRHSGEDSGIISRQNTETTEKEKVLV